MRSKFDVPKGDEGPYPNTLIQLCSAVYFGLRTILRSLLANWMFRRWESTPRFRLQRAIVMKWIREHLRDHHVSDRRPPAVASYHVRGCCFLRSVGRRIRTDTGDSVFLC